MKVIFFIPAISTDLVKIYIAKILSVVGIYWLGRLRAEDICLKISSDNGEKFLHVAILILLAMIILF